MRPATRTCSGRSGARAAACGVVTGLELELVELSQVYAGALFWPLERAGEVLRRWLELTPELPEEVTSLGRLLQFPPFPEIPEPLRGRAFAVVEAACQLDEAQAAPLLAPLRELDPAMDTFATMPPAGLADLHMDPPDPLPGSGGHVMLDSPPPDAIDAVVEIAGAGTDSPLVSLELRHTGGALARRDPGNGALASLDGTLSLFGSARRRCRRPRPRSPTASGASPRRSSPGAAGAS